MAENMHTLFYISIYYKTNASPEVSSFARLPRAIQHVARNTTRRTMFPSQAEDDEGHAMTDEELWEDVHDIMGAGHETTATTTAAVLYCVSAHPHVVTKVRAELDAVIGAGSILFPCRTVRRSDRQAKGYMWAILGCGGRL
jgi:cytochrome P450